MEKRLKIDIHNHILPERWPDLKEVSFEALSFSLTSVTFGLFCSVMDMAVGYN